MEVKKREKKRKRSKNQIKIFTYFVLIEGQYTRTCIISKMCGLPYGHGMRQQQELLLYGLMVLFRSIFFSFVLFFVRLVRPKYII